MLSDKSTVCPNNLLDLAHQKKGIKVAIANAGKTLPMISVMDAVKEKLIVPVLIGDETEIKKSAEDIKFDISEYEIIDEPVENNTAKIAAKLASEDKIKIIEALWSIIYSNEDADIYETNLMRRLAGLLYIDSKTMGDIKNRIQNEKP